MGQNGMLHTYSSELFWPVRATQPSLMALDHCELEPLYLPDLSTRTEAQPIPRPTP